MSSLARINSWRVGEGKTNATALSKVLALATDSSSAPAIPQAEVHPIVTQEDTVKIYLKDGRVADVALTEKALVALHAAAEKNRIGMPIQVKIDGHFEIIAIGTIDMERTLDQPKTVAAWPQYQFCLPKVK